MAPLPPSVSHMYQEFADAIGIAQVKDPIAITASTTAAISTIVTSTISKTTNWRQRKRVRKTGNGRSIPVCVATRYVWLVRKLKSYN